MGMSALLRSMTGYGLSLIHIYRYQNVFVMLMFVLLLTGALSGPLGIVQNFFYRIIITIAKLPFQLFGAI